MITFASFIDEALKPSQYRSIVKGWDQTRLEKIFQQWPGKKNHKATRLYIELPISQSAVQADSQVSNKLTQLGYDIVDYRQGLARKKTGNQNPTRIGKILSAAARTGDTEATAALQTFQNDPKRTSSQSEYIGVVSRHPYDIAGMSTDRGWTSCQNLVDGGKCEYVPKDIHAGTLIAYMINKDDVNINKPVGRILLKPYVNKKNQTAYALHDEEYGGVTPEFREKVNQFAAWLNKQQGISGLFKMHPNVYGGGKDQNYIRKMDKIAILPPFISDQELLQLVKKDSAYLKAALLSDIEPNEKMLLTAVKSHSISLDYIFKAGIKPSEDVMLAAITKDAFTLRHILDAGIRPSKDVMLAAVKNSPILLDYIIKAGIKPNEDVMLAAVTKDALTLRHILNAGIQPSKDVMLAAVATKPRDALFYILNTYKINPKIKPSEDVMLAAVTKEGVILSNILKAGIRPSEDVMLAAVTNMGLAIGYIIKAGIKPSEDVMLAAVTKDGRAIEFIIKAGIEPSHKVYATARKNGWSG